MGLQPSSNPSFQPSLQPSLSLQPSFSPSSEPSLQPSSSLEPSLQPSSKPSFQPSSNPSSFPSVFDPFGTFENLGECVNSAGQNTEDANNRFELLTYDNVAPGDLDAIASNAGDCSQACNQFYFSQA